MSRIPRRLCRRFGTILFASWKFECRSSGSFHLHGLVEGPLSGSNYRRARLASTSAIPKHNLNFVVTSTHFQSWLLVGPKTRISSNLYKCNELTHTQNFNTSFHNLRPTRSPPSNLRPIRLHGCWSHHGIRMSTCMIHKTKKRAES